MRRRPRSTACCSGRGRSSTRSAPARTSQLADAGFTGDQGPARPLHRGVRGLRHRRAGGDVHRRRDLGDAAVRRLVPGARSDRHADSACTAPPKGRATCASSATTANGQPAAALYMLQSRERHARGVPAARARHHGPTGCRMSWRSSTPRCSRSSACPPRSSRRVATYATRSSKIRAMTGHSAPAVAAAQPPPSDCAECERLSALTFTRPRCGPGATASARERPVIHSARREWPGMTLKNRQKVCNKWPFVGRCGLAKDNARSEY